MSTTEGPRAPGGLAAFLVSLDRLTARLEAATAPGRAKRSLSIDVLDAWRVRDGIDDLFAILQQQRAALDAAGVADPTRP